MELLNHAHIEIQQHFLYGSPIAKTLSIELLRRIKHEQVIENSKAILSGEST